MGSEQCVVTSSSGNPMYDGNYISFVVRKRDFYFELVPEINFDAKINKESIRD